MGNDPPTRPDRDAPSRPRLSSWWAPLIVALVSLCATFIATRSIHTLAEEDRAAQVRRASQSVFTQVNELFQEYTNALYHTLGYVRASEEITLDEWKSFVRESRLESIHPGVWGFRYVERVEPERLDRFVESMRAQGAEDFAIKNHTRHDDRGSGRAPLNRQV